MMNLMEGQLYIVEQDIDRQPKHRSEYARIYSHPLESLVADCLSVDPASRPSVTRLLYETRVGIQRWEAAYGDVSGVNLPERFTVPCKGEEFAIGVQHPGLAPRRRVMTGPLVAPGVAPEGPVVTPAAQSVVLGRTSSSSFHSVYFSNME